MDHFNLLVSIAELNWVFSHSRDIETFLQKIVDIVSRHMEADVCSIYLFDESDETLTLTANVGLNASLIGTVRIKLSQGLVGLSLRELRPICEKNSSAHPSFLHFKALGEEQFDAFLAVPILRGIQRIGVLVCQRDDRRPFKDTEATLVKAVANQLANILENARILTSMSAIRLTQNVPVKPAEVVIPERIVGKTASGGFACGRALVENRHRSLSDAASMLTGKQFSLDDFSQAVRATERQLRFMQEEIEEQLSDVASLIFGAHLLLLKDRNFTGEMQDYIEHGMAATEAVVTVAGKLIAFFKESGLPQFTEKADDVRDLALRILANLSSDMVISGGLNAAGRIVVAHDMLPSDILKLAAEKTAGIVLISGGVTSHLAILSRSLGLPVIICDEPALLSLCDTETVLLDGEHGTVLINPSHEVETEYRRACEDRRAADTSTYVEPTTRDGTRITLGANVNLIADALSARRLNTDGIGLYRTEFPFIIRSTFPTEEEQFVVYERLVRGMDGKPVTFRTLDIGGDKVLSYYHDFRENNPYLGMRSIRFALTNPDIFRQQLRAILRAGSGTKLRIMFPMISSVDEFVAAKSILEDCGVSLDNEGTPRATEYEVGMMVEMPSVLELLEELAEVSDFFSIGTNDFIQYMLAVDRTNEKVAPFYIPHHPAVIRGIKRVVDAGKKFGRDVSVCGDMAQDERFIPLLLGMGVRTLSVDPGKVDRIRKCVANVTMIEAEKFSGEILKLKLSADVAKRIDTLQ